MPDLSDLSHSSQMLVDQILPGSVDPLNTPISERSLSHFISDRAQSYLNLDYLDETILGNSHAGNIGMLAVVSRVDSLVIV